VTLNPSPERGVAATKKDAAMDIVQWVIAAGTAIFVALVGFFQWRTAQQKIVLDLFDTRHEIYSVVRKAVGTMVSSSLSFDQQREIEFMETMEKAKFFFGDDIQIYLKKLWEAILDVRTVDVELPSIQDVEARRESLQKRRAALDFIVDFHTTGLSLFAKYMRFSQTVKPSFLK
jgi:hypothetical protein